MEISNIKESAMEAQGLRGGVGRIARTDVDSQLWTLKERGKEKRVLRINVPRLRL